MIDRPRLVRDTTGPAGRPGRRRGTPPTPTSRDRFHPLYRAGPGAAAGRSVGLPRPALRSRHARRGPALDPGRSRADDRPSRAAAARATWSIAHFSDSWRDAHRRAAARASPSAGSCRPASRSPATSSQFADGGSRAVDVRRRVEIADGIIGWGFVPFAAIGHRRRRDARLARPVRPPGARSLRAGRPRRGAHGPARLVGRQPRPASPTSSRRPTTTSPTGSTPSRSRRTRRADRAARHAARRAAGRGPTSSSRR